MAPTIPTGLLGTGPSVKSQFYTSLQLQRKVIKTHDLFKSPHLHLWPQENSAGTIGMTVKELVLLIRNDTGSMPVPDSLSVEIRVICYTFSGDMKLS